MSAPPGAWYPFGRTGALDLGQTPVKAVPVQTQEPARPAPRWVKERDAQHGRRRPAARSGPGTLSEVARDLQAEPDENQTLQAIVAAAVHTIPGVVSGGISQVHRRQISTQVPSDDLVARCDQAQDELGEGPCLDVIWDQHTVIVNDLPSDGRWPRFGPRAGELGAGSLISFQLWVGHDNLGALNLYGGPGARFGEEAQLVGELFASHAAIALSGARQNRQMNEALASRDAIGQAKGLLMARHNLTGLQAFDLLVRGSQESNIKLSEVATWLVNEHEHPDGDNRPPSGPGLSRPRRRGPRGPRPRARNIGSSDEGPR